MFLDQTEIEQIEMQQRMNDYPPSFARLSNILEARPEARMIYKIENNFFSLFKNPLSPIFIVFLIIIFDKLICKKK